MVVAKKRTWKKTGSGAKGPKKLLKRYVYSVFGNMKVGRCSQNTCFILFQARNPPLLREVSARCKCSFYTLFQGKRPMLVLFLGGGRRRKAGFPGKGGKWPLAKNTIFLYFHWFSDDFAFLLWGGDPETLQKKIEPIIKK